MNTDFEQSFRNLRRSSTWAGLLLVLVAAITLEAATLIQYYYSRRAIKEEAGRRAEAELTINSLKIMDVVDQTEAAVRNSVWIAQFCCLNMVDSLQRVAERVVADNPVVKGSTVALVPGYNENYPLLSPYCFEEDGVLRFSSLATPEYDYPSQEWFRKPLELGTGYWSEPYWDEGGGDILMTTYSVPLFDDELNPVAVLTADISLDWLTDLVGKVGVYEDSYSVLYSRAGNFMVGLRGGFVIDQSVWDLSSRFDDPAAFENLLRAQMNGESGVASLRRDGELSYAYYAPVQRTGWSMAIVIPDKSIYASLRKVTSNITLLQLLGLLMILFILWAVIRNLLRYQDLNQKRERLEGELHTARTIQMAMIPKIFPPFPDRTDIDMAAIIVPAKEVGGDLYDFYIRDEKLIFCIGDVSGKGVPASLLMAVTRSLFRTVSAHEDSPQRIVSSLNDSMAETNENSMFVTFFCGVLDMASGILRYCNAGHNAPLVFTDHVEKLPVESNIPLGVVPGMNFREQSIDLHYDDALFLYTDGVTEAENEQQELFGEERMEEVMHVRRGAIEQLNAVRDAVSAFVGEAPQSDDITMLFIHYMNTDVTLDGGRHLLLHNDIRQIPQLAQFVETIAQEKHLDQSLAMNLNLALEEAVTNVILYAYPKGSVGLVDVEALLRDDAIDFIISDTGMPFDPTAAPDADVSLGVKERPVGGLGIYLVRHIMDSIHYERKHGKNVLTLTKVL